MTRTTSACLGRRFHAATQIRAVGRQCLTMPLDEQTLLDLRAEYFADDIEILPQMQSWTVEEARKFFEDPPMEPMAKSTMSSDAPLEISADVEGAGDQLSSLSIKELKARCAAAGLSTDDCLNKDDLMQRVREAPDFQAVSTVPVNAPPVAAAVIATAASTNWWQSLSTKEIKRALEGAGVSTDACFERVEFESLAKRHPCARCSTSSADGASMTPTSSDFWASYSAKQLRTLLSERGIPTSGLLDREDFLQAANANRTLLTAAVTVGSPRSCSGTGSSRLTPGAGGKTSALDARQARLELEEQRKVKEGLDALGGVVRICPDP